VAVGGTPGIFVAEALAVLEGANRIQTTDPGGSDLLVAQNGVGLDQRAPQEATWVIPPDDPTLLPALNRRLVDAGIPWRLDARDTSGEADLVGTVLAAPLARVRVRSWFDLLLSGDPPGPTRTLAEIGGRPWAVEGTDDAGRRYLIVASSMEAGATTLPVSTGMLRFVDWVASEWSSAGSGLSEFAAGGNLPAPSDATHIRFPSGTESEIDGTRTVRGTGEAGIYTFLASDTVVSVVALNPPEAESRLAPLASEELASAIGDNVVDVARENGWGRAVYRARQGPELWWAFLLGVMALLTIEAFAASSGQHQGRRVPKRSRPEPAIDGID
jgi:hypothetical protein